jgi:hypothetical protein
MNLQLIMPDNVLQSSAPEWSPTTEQLAFQFGRWVFGTWRFASLTNRTSPLLQKEGPDKVPPILQPVTYQQMADQGDICRTLYIDHSVIRYVPYRGKRYYVDLRAGTFDQYLKKFSKKTRYNLRRTVQQFAKQSGGILDFRCYRSQEEMAEFCQHAAAVSRLSYQHKIGFGFPEGEGSTKQLMQDAATWRVSGFVLMYNATPVSYALCRINSDIITYSSTGYDPQFVRLSPGKVLLYTIIEKLFSEGNFHYFDFGGQEWDYKALHATGSIAYLRVIWFPKTAKNLSFVLAHYILLLAWRAAARIKHSR